MSESRRHRPPAVWADIAAEKLKRRGAVLPAGAVADLASLFADAQAAAVSRHVRRERNAAIQSTLPARGRAA